MTRACRCCFPLLSLAVAFSAAFPAAAPGQTYTNPSANSRYAPANAPGGQAGQQPGRAFGPLAATPQARAGDGVRQADNQPLRPPVGPAPGFAGPPLASAAPQEPAWLAEMGPEQHEWVARVLHYWEQRSNKVKMFEGKFDRFEYQPALMNNPADAQYARTISQGVIKYAQPDKGLYRVEKLFSFGGPPKAAGEKPQYIEQDATFGEHWVCDGQQVFQFDARNKRMYVRQLPPEMRGKAIADGPLPFMFGARAETIQARYWVRDLPQSGNGKYWLEAVPKSRQDAQNFKMVHIILDESDYLPEMIQVFEPNYDPVTNAARITYIFKDRQAKDANALQALGAGLNALNLFHREFYAPKLPPGWQRVEQND